MRLRRESASRGPTGGRSAGRPVEYSILLTAAMCLIALGTVMVFSASSVEALAQNGGDGSYYLKRVLIYAAIGLAVMLILSRRGLGFVKSWTPALLGLSVILLVAVLIPGVGRGANGAQRWIGTGPVQVQPSELAKLAIICYAAGLLAAKPGRLDSLKTLVSPLLVTVGAIVLLVLMEPDMGTAMVAVFATVAVLVMAGAHMRHLALLAGAVLLVAVIAIAIEPYRQARLFSFLSPMSDLSGAGYQSYQGMIAMGSGGLFGVGLGESVQKFLYLPEAHTDMMLAVIGEELGLVGIWAVVFLYGLIAYAGLRIAESTQDTHAKLLAAGVTALIVVQAILNFGAVLGLLPLTGIPLPFLSYGGSSLIVTMAGVGLLLNIALTSGSTVGRRAKPTGAAHASLEAVKSQAARSARSRRARAGAHLRPVGHRLHHRDDTDRDSHRRDRRARRARVGRRS